MDLSIHRVSPVVTSVVIGSMIFSNSALAIHNIALLSSSGNTNEISTNYFDISSLKNHELERAIKTAYPQQERLFDKSVASGFNNPSSLLVERYFENVSPVSAIQIYGSAGYQLSVEQKINNLWTQIPALTGVDWRLCRKGNGIPCL